MVILAIITSLFVAIQDPIIQKFAVRFASGYLSEKTGADIKVGRLAISPDLRLFVDDVVVKDLRGNDLVKIGKLRAKVFVEELLDGKIHLRNVDLSDTEANLITYQGEEKMNFAFLAEAFASDKPKEKESKPLELWIDKISLKNIDFMLWNQNMADSVKTANHRMDYAHLDLDDINLEASDFYIFGDSIRANIANLSARELSGFELKSFQSDAIVSQSGIRLNGLLMETNNSNFDLDLNMLFSGFDDISNFVDSVVFDATIRPSDIMLSDIGVFADVMYKMPDRVNFEGRFIKMSDYINPETIARYEAGFNKFAKNGALPVLQIVQALEVAKEDFTADDVFDALEIMGIKDQPITIDQFMDLIGIMKDPETIIDAFSIFDTDKRGVIDEDELRSMLRKYAPDLKGKEIEEILEKPNVTTNGKVNYKAFVQYWMDQ